MAEIQNDYVEKIITGSTQMSFIDKLWGFEVTGGADQGQPLTISAIKRDGLAQRAGMRVADQILRINDIECTNMSLQEAQLMISQSGRYVRIAVFGEDDDIYDEGPAPPSVDYWFKPPKLEDKPTEVHTLEQLAYAEEHEARETELRNAQEKAQLERLERHRLLKMQGNTAKWNGAFPWNDRPKPVHKSSNCAQVVRTRY